MSNQNNNNTTINSSSAAAIRSIRESMIRGNSNYIGEVSGNADPDMEIKPKLINLHKDELLFFSDVPDTAYCCVELKEKSEINNAFLQILQKLFADVISAQLEYSNKFNRWIFVTSFRFITNEQFEAIEANSDDELYRAVNSTFDPTQKQTSSIAENLLSMQSVQNMPASDATRYASISKEAKELLYNFVYFGNTKNKKWIRDENYEIKHVTNTSYNGSRYNNIIANIYLDAEKVLSLLGAVAEDKKKYLFTLNPISSKMNNMDNLFEVKRYSLLKRRKYSAKYGIQFSNN